MPVPTPNANETENEFIARCHAALANEFSTDQRNAICFRTWRENRGESDLYQKAAESFTDEEFVCVRDVPVFTEHETKDREGKPVIYDRAALAAVAEKCNQRIRDTGDFSPITEGHTPDADQYAAGAHMPDVLGYSGPFRLGQIGNDEPRWTIFTDEWRHREDLQKFKKLRRRSPELWSVNGPMESRFMDPIAALGAETPRLDLGLTRFCLSGNGQFVEKYMAAGPSSASVFVESDDLNKKNYQAQEPAMALQPEDVQQIVEAINGLDWVQWVKSQMANAPVPTAEVAPDAAPVAEVAPDPEKAPYSADECDKDKDEKMEYEAASGTVDENDKPTKDADVADPGLMKFSRLKSDFEAQKKNYSRLEERNKSLETRLAKVEGDKRNVERYSVLSNLQASGYQFDVDAEAKRVAGYDDDRFRDHVEIITEHYSRIPLASHVPAIYAPELDRPQGNQEKYKKNRAERAVSICSQEHAKGNKISYDEALKQAEVELGQKVG